MAAVAKRREGSLEKVILQEIQNFVGGKTTSEDTVKSSLYLFKTLPSCRDAVFEYFCNVFEEAATNYMIQLELGSNLADSTGHSLDSAIEDIKEVLMDFMKNNPKAWAPIISSWSMNLLGHVSSKFGERRTAHHAGLLGLNETLQLWMTCRATKTLVEMASECFASMVGSSPDSCVDSLLQASVNYSPHFDWVVAHIGSCFPKTIVERVLYCGLKDFCHHENSQSASGSQAAYEKVPKMGSVVGVLGHLAGHHSHDIMLAIQNMFQESISSNDVTEAQLLTIPFLLHLASMSPMLLHILTINISTNLKPPVLKKIVSIFATHKIHQDYDSSVDLVVYLLSKVEYEAFNILIFLLDTITCSDSEIIVKDTAVLILTQMVQNVQRYTHSKCSDPGTKVPFLSSLQKHATSLCEKFLELTTGISQKLLGRLLLLVSIHGGENSASQIMSYLIQHSKHIEQLQLVLVILQEIEARQPTILSTTITVLMNILHNTRARDNVQVIANIKELVSWEEHQYAGNRVARNSMTLSLQSHVTVLASQLIQSEHDVRYNTLWILNAIQTSNMDNNSVLKVTQNLAGFIFRSLEHEDLLKKSASLKLCLQYIKQLCESKVARKYLLRLLLEESLHTTTKYLFGSRVESEKQSNKIELPEAQLLSENQRHAIDITTPQSHSTAFHAGVIGRGLRHPVTKTLPNKENVVFNKQMFVNILKTVSTMDCEYSAAPKPIITISMNTDSSETVADHEAQHDKIRHTYLASLVLELVSPDVLYTECYWPGWEFTKNIVERDILIGNKFDDVSILWDIMDLISSDRESMVICACLLRGVMAKNIRFWEGCREKISTNAPKQLETTLRLLDCLKKACFLPTPLVYISELIHMLAPHEVHALLLNSWRFLQDNCPTENIATISKGCDPKYLKVIRSILHSNIDKLGQYYDRFCHTDTTSEWR